MNSRKKILIVDDEQINLEFFDVMLTKLGFIVEKAEDGVEALEKVKRFMPDLIMLDNIMPKMSGWEVTKTLKNDPKYREIPIIMFSAMDDVKDKVEGFELGVDDYITKPYNFSVVLARIRAVLRNRELLGQIVVRESRLTLAEELSTDMKNKVAAFLQSMDDLDNTIAVFNQKGITMDEEATVKVVQAVQAKTAAVRKNIAELDARIERTMVEWDDLKKKEIGLKTLENQIRRDSRPEPDMVK
ncbi:response regulator transcription factor [Breznakiella homolactica]|uniref:Response regulator n=1 Tax=Breznakiella homolactica TaxID=2798577 RepID=A0A7T8B9F1_9SPIR|nr:response regulator [Breznakiella homolactica]QQO08387.1 response regulator [Breznakiella homolactica]